MLVFVDESGDAGFKFDKNSSQYFVVAMVVFADDEDAEIAKATIQKLHNNMNHTSEFKFAKLNNSQRVQFAQKTMNLEFQGFVVVFDKTKFESILVRQLGDEAYAWMLANALESWRFSLLNARIRLDGAASKPQKRQIATFLRRSLSTGVMHNLAFVESERTELIQLADFLAGATHRFYRGELQEPILQNLLQKIQIQEWKKQEP